MDVLDRGRSERAAGRARKTGSVVSEASSVRSLDVVKRNGQAAYIYICPYEHMRAYTHI